MATLKISGLSKSFGIQPVFENVSFEVKSEERIGLVGANGAGKTTLLKCIMGKEEADKGTVKASDGAVIGYLRQDFNYTSQTVRDEMASAWEDVLRCKDRMEGLAKELEAKPGDIDLIARYGRAQERFEFLGGYDYEAKTRRILMGLGFTDDDWDRDLTSFSGGQKVRINLATAFVRHPDFLLLDEPTNHLDMHMLEWLEDYLRFYKGGILMISHDRYFLDVAATGIIDLENHKIRTFRGGYTRYLTTKKSQDAAYEKAYEKQQEHIRETEEYIRRYKAGIKSKQARGRQSQLDRLERLEAPTHTKALQFHFDAPDDSGDKVLDILHADAAYGDHVVYQDLTLHIRKGETVGLIGPNGAGKSTLMKTVMGELLPGKGMFRLGTNVRPGYYSQEQEGLHDDLTILDEVRDMFNYGEGEARNILGMFLFQGDDVFKKVSLLSGGEKARLSLLCLFLQRPNFLILDEPTNHLDIPTREIMEEAIQAFGGTCFVISHDRYFLDKVATRIVELDSGTLTEYLGNYTYYKEKKKDLADYEADRKGDGAESVQRSSAPSVVDVVSVDEKAVVSSSAIAKINQVEMEIGRLEATLKMYAAQMTMLGDDYEATAQAYGETEEKLNALYEKWEALNE